MNHLRSGEPRFVATLVTYIVLCFGYSVRADSWIAPHEFDVFSENGKFRAHVIPGKLSTKPVLIVFSGNSTNENWRTKLSNSTSPTEVLLSNDGESVVTFDNWYGSGYGDDVVAVYNRYSQLAKYSLEQIAPPPPPPKSKKGEIELPPLHGYYGTKFTHSTSSRHWRQNSIEFFYRETNQLLFCLWLDWENRWVAWQMTDGQLTNVSTEGSKKFNAHGRERILARARTNLTSADLNFLGRLRYQDDRPLIESWLQDAEFSGGSIQSYSSSNGKNEHTFTITASSYKRETADGVLRRWDGKVSSPEGSRENPYYLGNLNGTVIFPTAPAKNEGTIRLYLIPEATSLNQWAATAPAQYMIADLKYSYPHVFEKDRMSDGTLSNAVNFIIYGVTPGRYRLKAIWDKAAPFAKENEIVCQPSSGDYESTKSPLVSIYRARTTDRIKIDCNKLVTN
jgi:hypothetical protein